MIENLPKSHSQVSHNVCAFHKHNPGKEYAGCTCSSAYEFITS